MDFSATGPLVKTVRAAERQIVNTGMYEGAEFSALFGLSSAELARFAGSKSKKGNLPHAVAYAKFLLAALQLEEFGGEGWEPEVAPHEANAVPVWVDMPLQDALPLDMVPLGAVPDEPVPVAEPVQAVADPPWVWDDFVPSVVWEIWESLLSRLRPLWTRRCKQLVALMVLLMPRLMCSLFRISASVVIKRILRCAWVALEEIVGTAGDLVEESVLGPRVEGSYSHWFTGLACMFLGALLGRVR